MMGDLMLGTGLRHYPGEGMGEVATRVALEVVVQITDRVGWMRTQYIGQGIQNGFAYPDETW